MSRWIQKWPVGSFTTDKTYTVAVDGNGVWGCSCPRWIFKRRDLPNQECKHIEFVKANLDRAAEVTFTPEQAVQAHEAALTPASPAVAYQGENMMYFLELR